MSTAKLRCQMADLMSGIKIHGALDFSQAYISTCASPAQGGLVLPYATLPDQFDHGSAIEDAKLGDDGIWTFDVRSPDRKICLCSIRTTKPVVLPGEPKLRQQGSVELVLTRGGVMPTAMINVPTGYDHDFSDRAGHYITRVAFYPGWFCLPERDAEQMLEANMVFADNCIVSSASFHTMGHARAVMELIGAKDWKWK